MRIVQACQWLGVDFVCLYTKEDAASGHVALARKHGGPKSLYPRILLSRCQRDSFGGG